ncbi:molybdenum cofactor guanylyltransferase [Marispirochaeta sp.]|uniref:molybdenum cofactor guanylyltransferase n=1 Tax=Marispirochaeta sp. TaxID=2038653 RepID=UPI0029C7430B|nr:molybdenum cofactor guanylyltransferase [Marispirochaeta sp.]
MPEIPAEIPVSALILAGGSSSRMGQDKARLKIGDTSLLQQIISRMADRFEEIIISVPASAEFRIPGVRTVCDIFPGAGPLGGIHAGLKATGGAVFVTACDMPFFDTALAAHVLSRTDAFDAVVPKNGGFTEPLFGVYLQSALPKMEEYLRSDNRSVNRFLSLVNTHYVPESEVRRFADPARVFFNVNTPRDYLHLLTEYP